jgi:cytochrome c-type biogenesis protein CcmI
MPSEIGKSDNFENARMQISNPKFKISFRRWQQGAVYREQFAEMEADFRAGIVDREQHDRDHEELERRLLEDWGQMPQSP